MAGGRTGMDDVLEIGNRALDAADREGARARRTAAAPKRPDFFYLLLFFLLLIAPFLLAVLVSVVAGGPGSGTFDPGEVKPAVVDEVPTTVSITTTVPATTTTSITVVQPPTEVIEGPAPSPASENPPAPDTSQQPHGG